MLISDADNLSYIGMATDVKVNAFVQASHGYVRYLLCNL
jgi:hypothetical protein